jgi:hypothetical protein
LVAITSDGGSLDTTGGAAMGGGSLHTTIAGPDGPIGIGGESRGGSPGGGGGGAGGGSLVAITSDGGPLVTTGGGNIGGGSLHITIGGGGVCADRSIVSTMTAGGTTPLNRPEGFNLCSRYSGA